MSQDELREKSFDRDGDELPKAGTLTSGKATACVVLGGLSFLFAVLTAVPGTICGVLAWRDIRRQKQLRGKGLVIAGIFLALAGSGANLIFALLVVVPAQNRVGEAKRRLESTANIKKIALGLRKYHDTYGYFPHPGSVELLKQQSKERSRGKYPRPGVGLSWRVRLLPLLGEQELFEQFHLDEPWDGPHNRRLIERMPDVYRSPYRAEEDYKTVYQCVVGGGREQRDVPYAQAAFSLDTYPVSLMNFKDGTTYTITLVEVACERAVTWTRPEDWSFDPNQPRRGLESKTADAFLAAFADSSIDAIPDELDDETLRRLFCRNDGEQVQGYKPPAWKERSRKTRSAASQPKPSRPPAPGFVRVAKKDGTHEDKIYLRVQMRSDGTMCFEEQAFPLTEFEDRLTDWLESRNAPPEKVRMEVQVDSDTPMGKIAEVIHQLLASDVHDYVIRITQE